MPSFKKTNLLSGFGENYVQIISFNLIWMPHRMTYDVRVSNEIISMGTPSYL